MHTVHDLDRERLLELLRVHALNWLAHDGCWFLGAEERDGWDSAQELNEKSWRRFTRVEARRILKFMGIGPGGGTEALAQALQFRLYAQVNDQEIVEMDEHRLVFTMKECRVQAARRRKGLPLHKCKSAGIIEYAGFAETIDPRFRTRCIVCPPDETPPGVYCSWEFTLEG
ncbi:MAG: hypothetical protein GXP54_10850 [Deltaproteobacteria bacterium]|nr:hypothetical protein [Deltaproteobacteria bacterium]